MKTAGTIIGFTLVGALILGIVFGLMCLSAWLFMLLWNWIGVSLLHGPHLSFWQSFGVTALLSFIGQMLFDGGKK